MRLINRLETEPDTMTLALLADECNRLVNLRKDTSMVEQQEVNSVHKAAAHTDTRATSTNLPKAPCWLCGGVHFVRECEYANHRCAECQQVGHKEGYCGCIRPSRNIPYKQNRSGGGRGDGNNWHRYKSRSLVCNQVLNVASRKYVVVLLNGVKTDLQIDTASDITVISEKRWAIIGKPVTTTTSARALTASGSNLQLSSQFQATLTLAGKSKQGTVYVTKSNLNILGIDWIERFGIWDVPISSICRKLQLSDDNQIRTLKSRYSDVFSNEPSVCAKVEVNLTVKEGAVPVFRPKRPVSFGSLNLVEQELDRLERRGVITPVSYSDWAAPIVVVKKSDKTVRICGDYSTGLNAVLTPHKYPLPTPDEIFATLTGGIMFSILDLRDGYLLMNVSEESRIPGVKPYIDDVIITGCTKAEHDDRLEQVLKKFREFGLRLKEEKCQFFAESVKYLGHIIDRTGIRPDPEKALAISNMPAPTDVATLRSFLGAVNYYGKFIPHMRNLRYPLDNLLKSSNTHFEWTEQCQKSFDSFKTILLSDLALTHYDPHLPVIVSADASNFGIGACIQHVFPDGTRKAIYHVSRALSSAEQNYGQIEKEGLALIFAVTRFHRFIYGRHFKLETDHKPLLSIFGSKKGVPVYAANRLQRWAVTLLAYDFEILYVRTTDFGNADLLSRLINRCAKPDDDIVIAAVSVDADLKEVLHVAINSLNIPLSFRMIRSAFNEDDELSKVVNFLQNGWPVSTNKLQGETKKFYEIRDSLSITEGCLMFGDRLVIPRCYRTKVLKQLHTAHPGIERMKALARSYIYWPRLDSDIQEWVRGCGQCAISLKAPARAIPQAWPETTRPFQRVHIDYAGPHYATTIKMLRDVFCRFGMPETLVSDNGRQFTADIFLEFCTQNGIEHIRSPPYHPQSNGQAERFVDTFKRSLAKIYHPEGDLQSALDTFLLNYRITPNRNASEGKSPSELLFGRRIRSHLDLLLPPKDTTKYEVPDVIEAATRKDQQQTLELSRKVGFLTGYESPAMESTLKKIAAFVPVMIVE
ncbi:uncharacterized protein K02A2.6-like [Uranotaenia lowii]|uniref:uncharacterized protein K02A2.6-like n=1 Tax=Uranotaenia lowii TaxID=190385 RepID=UPI002478341A|nr:uncharacterized protein K02A2.6-like [Uranotaenia lowii]